ncbi:MAG TPA: sigma-70 family RNA polymerase sigma factor [Casimicrobiaceae bacterium]|nr:sigma-70 family RNA polymerase sigma factor [Casimicrobiaceae bacterium]
MTAAETSERNARLAQLLARTALSDRRAFEELYIATSPHLYGVAIRMLKETTAAEDVLQETYVAIWHHAGSYQPDKSQPLTWLSAIVRNRCLDALRRRELDTIPMTSDDDHDLEFPAGSATPAELLLQGADAAKVRECVELLEGGARQAIALAFFQGLTHAELATHMREPLGTVKSWVRRGLERLRQCLDRAGVTR